MAAILSVVTVSLLLMVQQRLRLTYKLGVMLLLVYAIYFVFELC